MDILGMEPVQGLESVSRYPTVIPCQEDGGGNTKSQCFAPICGCGEEYCGRGLSDIDEYAVLDKT